MSNVFQVIGPPGCGKTTYLKRQAERAAAVFGGGDVVICSLTKAAAAEIRSRLEGIPDGNVGTLHALCYRALHCPEIAETKLAEWNELHPEFALSSASGMSGADPDDLGSVAEIPERATNGDASLSRMNIARQRMLPEDMWPTQIRPFAKAWQEWLASTDRIDFTGMIERALPLPLRETDALLVDEAQDLSRLEVALVQKWAETARTTALVGDPAQNLYEWRGSEPEAFSGAIGGDMSRRRILAQSYRVPVAAHAAAVKWAGDLLDGVEYRPTEQAGEIDRLSATWKNPEPLLGLIEKHASGKAEGSVMLMTSCSYMLGPLLAVMRKEGIPFHNPLRSKRGDWNPLAERTGRKKDGSQTVGTLGRVKQFIDGSGFAWLRLLRSGDVLARGVKTRLDGGWEPESVDDLLSCFASPEKAEAALAQAPAWLVEHCRADKRDRIGYLARIVDHGGAERLAETPRVQVGTIHSFKGGEADHVVVFPDLSRNGMIEWLGVGKASVRRAFYVALTRTRDKLTLCAPATPMHVRGLA